MDTPVDVLWLTRQMWKRRIPILAAFLSMLIGGIVASFMRRPEYRATAEITVADPAGFHKVGASTRRDLGLLQIRREALAEHAAQLSDPAWAAEVLEHRIGLQDAERLAGSVRGVVVPREVPDAVTLSLSITGDQPGILAEAVNALADAYATSASAWPEQQVQTSVAAIHTRRGRIETRLAALEGELLQFAGEEPEQLDPSRALLLAARATAADALAQMAGAEVSHAQAQLRAALAVPISDTEEAAAITAHLADCPLPVDLEAALRQAELEKAARALAVMGWAGALEDLVELDHPAGEVLPGMPEPALREALTAHLEGLTGSAVDLGMEGPAVLDQWLAARAAAVRARVYREAGARLRRQIQTEALRDSRADPLLQEIRTLRRALVELAEAEALFAAELADPLTPAAVAVSLRAVPPTRPIAMPLVKRVAFSFAVAVLAALALGLALETFLPSRREHDGCPVPTEGAAGDHPAA